MAQLTYEAANEYEAARPQNSGEFEFFTLKNDGDEAVVRIMHDSTDTFPIFSLHDVSEGGKRRKVGCLRESPRDDIAKCPLCATGNTASNRFFIIMIKYMRDSEGAIVGVPCVWDRSIAYAQKLKNMIDEYGPLSDCLFKIKRNGAANSLDTTYEILYCPEKQYPTSMYPRMDEAAAAIKIGGNLIQDRTYQDIVTFINTGKFPDSTAESVQTPVAPAYTNNIPQPTTQYVPKPQAAPVPDLAPAQQAPAYVNPQVPPVAPVATPASAPVMPQYPQAPITQPPFDPPFTTNPTNAVPMGRPTRYY